MLLDNNFKASISVTISTSQYLLIQSQHEKTRTVCEICSKLTITTPERRQWHCPNLLLTLNRFHSLFYCFHSWLWASKHRLLRYQFSLTKTFAAQKLKKSLMEKLIFCAVIMFDVVLYLLPVKSYLASFPNL